MQDPQERPADPPAAGGFRPGWGADLRVQIVRTVAGDVDPAGLGPVDAHEHLFLTTPLQPGDGFADVGLAIEEARTLAAAGAAALADWTPLGLGRDPDGLLRVSRATGLHIIAATGVHHDGHYPAGHQLRELSAAALAGRFQADITGPGVRSGLIKVGASYHRLAPFELTALEAAAQAHAETGAPVGVHTGRGTMGLAVVERLRGLGVPPDRVLLAHLDRNPDAGEHAETGATGAWLQLAGPGRTKYWPDSTILALIEALAARGLAGRVLLGGDTGRRSMLRAYGGGPGMDYLFARFRPRLAAELGAELAEQVFVRNPARAFAFTPRPPDQAPAAAGPGQPARRARAARPDRAPQYSRSPT
jgi:predicted metal-dependent phosphotriesterase family hydrolase